MDDLSDRGLLDETLVVVIAEFGRTPRINKLGGRDHWGHVFSFAMAGAGIRGGTVVGASDKNGGYPATDPIRGGDVTATIFHLLGIDPNGVFIDRANQPHPLTRGEPITAMLGNSPATNERCTPMGDPGFVPPIDERLLLDTSFDSPTPLIPPTPPSRAKGWRGFPIWIEDSPGAFSVRKEAQSAMIGYGPAETAIEEGARAILAQEIRNARNGHFTFAVKLTGEASSPAEFSDVFLGNMTFRLVLFRFLDTKKDARKVNELASAEFRPSFGKTETFQVDKFLGSIVPGQNFPVGNGLGVAIVVEKKTPGPLRLSEGKRAAIRIHEVTLAFSPRQRDESVTS
jgi:hypothetical protein